MVAFRAIVRDPILIAFFAARMGDACNSYHQENALESPTQNCDTLGHMAANLRFSTGIEALVLMATEPEKFHTSQALAKALSTNAVVVRRLLSVLSRADLVASVKGPSGGSRLARSPKQITLRDIYRAVGGGELLHRSQHESAETKDLRKSIQGIFRKAEKSLESELDSTTLNQLIKKSGKKAAKKSEPPTADKPVVTGTASTAAN